MIGLEPRLACVQTLVRVTGTQSYSNLALDGALKRLGDSDARLCKALFQGTLERMLTLDACIAAHGNRPVGKFDLPVLCVLRCGIYELLYMHTPESAAVNLWTECVKKLRKTSAAGMVNAILRGFLRGGKHIPLPQEKTAALSVEYSVPKELAEILLRENDAQTVTAFLADALGEPPIYVRHNPLKCTAEQLTERYALEAVPEIPFAYRAKAGFRAQLGGMAEDAQMRTEGWFHVQDLASQLCCLALNAQPGETVLDVCAAPGGKTFTTAEMMQNKGRVFAYDLHENRVNLIRKGAKALGLSIISAAAGDARVSEKPQADRVLCDVPCSGYGVIRRKPEIRYKPLAETAGLPEIQYAILEAAVKAVKPGGVLVYSTCTVLKRENEEVVQRFLAAHPEYQPEKPWQNMPSLSQYAKDMTTLFPQMLGSDGFFICKIRNNS